MLVKNDTPFLFGFKASSRKPPAPELCAFARAKFDLKPGQPLKLCRSSAVDSDTINVLAEGQEGHNTDIDEAMLVLGQGSLRGDRFNDGDDGQRGEVLYPSDFADFKLNAECLLRGHAHLRTPAAQCKVLFSVGDWSKELEVIGTHVWVDRIVDGKKTDPAAFTSMPLDYAHAYGGPGFAENPVGKGHLDDAPEHTVEDDLYVPPRSKRSMVMASQQLPNVLYPGGRPLEAGLAASFGPLNPHWNFRRNKRGTEYDEIWRKTRAPYYAADFDWTYFSAAPPDQQIEGYLRGDEKVTFRNLHRESSHFSVRLPKLRIRVFVLDDQDSVREVPMVLDTLFADLEDDALYLTWRGLTVAQQSDLSDIGFGLVVQEPLDEAPLDARTYESRLRGFARDPIGLDEHIPQEMRDAAEASEKLAGDDEALESLLDHEDENNPVSALLANIGPIAKPVADAVRTPLNTVLPAMDQGAVRNKVVNAIKGGRHGGPRGKAAVAAQVRGLYDNLVRIENEIGPHPDVDAAFDKVESVGTTTDDPDPPGPGAQLQGADLSHQDLSGLDLSGADLSEAILENTRLQGAILVDATLTGAQLVGTDLSDADLSGANLAKVTSTGAKLLRAKLDGATLDMSVWSKADFSEASLQGATAEMLNITDSKLGRINARGIRLIRSNIDTSTMDETDLSDAYLERSGWRDCAATKLALTGGELATSSFKDCDLSGADFSGTQARECSFFGATLEDAQFSDGTFTGCAFVKAAASRAVFRNAVLSMSRFDRATLSDAQFDGASLKSTRLGKAMLQDANFSGATLYESDLSETRGKRCLWTKAKLTRVNFERSELKRP